MSERALPEGATAFQRHLRESPDAKASLRLDHAAERVLEWQKMGVLQGRMMKSLTAVAHLSDEDLLVEVKVAAVREREATARLIALLSQLDARRLFLGEGCSSLLPTARRCSTSPSTRHMDGSRRRELLASSRSF